MRRGAFGRRLGYEGGVLVNGTCDLIRRDRRGMISLAPRRGHGEKVGLSKSGRGPSLCWHPQLCLPASRVLRTESLLFVSSPACGICYGIPKGLRQNPNCRNDLLSVYKSGLGWVTSNWKLSQKRKGETSIEADVYLLFPPGGQRYYSLTLKYIFIFRELRL